MVSRLISPSKLLRLVVIFVLISLMAAKSSRADCEADVIDFSSSCNSECPMDGGAAACHFACHTQTIRMRAACKSPPPPKPEPKSSSSRLIGKSRIASPELLFDPSCTVDACPRIPLPWNDPPFELWPLTPCMVDECPQNPLELRAKTLDASVPFRQPPRFPLKRVPPR